MDAVRAKEILRGHSCVMVRTPLTSKVWSLREVEQYSKEVIDRCGRGGGFILNLRLPDRGTTAEYNTVLDSIREYGRLK
jgi:hypothetical protein